MVDLRKQLLSLFATTNQQSEIAENQKLGSDTKEYYNNFSHFENSYIIFLEKLSKSTRNEKLKAVLYSQHTKLTEVMKEHISNYLLSDKRDTILEDGEIDSIVMSLIAVYNGIMMNRLLGVKDEANKTIWMNSISGILGFTLRVG